MKTKKIIWFFIPIIAIIALFYLLGNQNERPSDPINKIIGESDYPYNGYYTKESESITAETLSQKLSNDKNVKKYAENITIEIYANKTISLECRLQNLDALFASSKTLSVFKHWATIFNGEQVNATLSLTKNDGQTAKLELKSIKVGSVTLDPQLLSPLLTDSAIAKEIQKIKYDEITFSDGCIAFTNGLPAFLK